jgi:hypothetical protein
LKAGAEGLDGGYGDTGGHVLVQRVLRLYCSLFVPYAFQSQLTSPLHQERFMLMISTNACMTLFRSG